MSKRKKTAVAIVHAFASSDQSIREVRLFADNLSAEYSTEYFLNHSDKEDCKRVLSKIALLSDQEFNVILVTDFTKTIASLLDLRTKNRWRTVAVVEGIDSETAVGELSLNLAYSISRYESETDNERKGRSLVNMVADEAALMVAMLEQKGANK